MKLLLISHQNISWYIQDLHLPLYQWYEIESKALRSIQDKQWVYRIKTRYGSIGWIPSENFLTPEEWRERNINLLFSE